MVVGLKQTIVIKTGLLLELVLGADVDDATVMSMGDDG